MNAIRFKYLSMENVSVKSAIALPTNKVDCVNHVLTTIKSLSSEIAHLSTSTLDVNLDFGSILIWINVSPLASLVIGTIPTTDHVLTAQKDT